jgi:hypothetical protein
MQHAELVERFSKLGLEVELGFTAEQTATEVERCPTAAWDMAKFALVIPYASAMDTPVVVGA